MTSNDDHPQHTPEDSIREFLKDFWTGAKAMAWVGLFLTLKNFWDAQEKAMRKDGLLPKRKDDEP